MQIACADASTRNAVSVYVADVERTMFICSSVVFIVDEKHTNNFECQKKNVSEYSIKLMINIRY
jgi:hypothetical protein